ncbi:DMT family transporter [Thalassovita aquimarina]|uniref:DMT family transporter n=1 Tax=Thalassovita aquimarina TaxID=2785917 RepID=UPI003566B678
MTQAARGHLAMLMFSALVAGSFSLGSLAMDHITPMALNAVRFAIAALLVGAAGALSTGIPRSTFRAPWRYLVLGGVFATYFVLMFYGLKTAQPVSAAAVFTLTPIMSALAGFVLLRQVTTSRMALALSIGGAGALWVIFRADVAALLRFQVGQGEVIYFWGCAAHAIYIPMVRMLNRGESAMAFTFGTLLACCGAITIVGWGDITATDWTALPGVVWAAILYTAVFASAMTFVLAQYATLRLPAAKVMAYTYLTPSWVLIWELALGHGVPTVWVLGGVILTVVALLLLLRNEH